MGNVMNVDGLLHGIDELVRYAGPDVADYRMLKLIERLAMLAEQQKGHPGAALSINAGRHLAGIGVDNAPRAL